MKKVNEDGIVSGAPVNNTGSTYTVAGLSSKSSKMAGYDPVLKFKKRKREVKEDNLDNTTLQSRKRFKKNSVPKSDPQTDVESEIIKFVETKTFEEFSKKCKNTMIKKTSQKK